MNKETQEMNMLKRTIATRRQRLSVISSDNGEPMVKADAYDPVIVVKPALPDMQPFTGDDIYVREGAAKMLACANRKLQTAGYYVIVGYGYRKREIQEKYWEEAKKAVKDKNPGWTDEQIEDEADKHAADPRVAGHLTGGCVDVTIGKDRAPVDMGVPLDEFTAGEEKIKTFGEGISGEQMSNRMMLYKVMTEAGFMPFFGEYWHFMYGDREWAYFSGLDKSLYSNIEFRP
jgi:D-alanyl-D-alanine dipeptidase